MSNKATTDVNTPNATPPRGLAPLDPDQVNIGSKPAPDTAQTQGQGDAEKQSAQPSKKLLGHLDELTAEAQTWEDAGHPAISKRVRSLIRKIKREVNALVEDDGDEEE